MEAMLADPILESPGARWPTEESTTAADGVGGGERLATMVADAMETLGAIARAAKSLEVGARAANIAPESGAGRLVVSKEQATLPKMSKGMVGRAARPLSPYVVLPAMEEEDEVEEIEREES